LNECRGHLWRGLSIGFMIAGILLGTLGLILYNWLGDIVDKLDVILAITSNPEYLKFIDKLAESVNTGQYIVIDKDEAGSLYPLASSIRTQIIMIDIDKGGAISNLMILTGIILTGVGMGWLIGFTLANRR